MLPVYSPLLAVLCCRIHQSSPRCTYSNDEIGIDNLYPVQRLPRQVGQFLIVAYLSPVYIGVRPFLPLVQAAKPKVPSVPFLSFLFASYSWHFNTV